MTDALDSPPRFASRKPRLNHVAMSLPAELLDAEHRALLVDFYSAVFGWEPYDMLTEDRRRLVFGAYSTEQFVFLIADESPMSTAHLDHFGLSVGSLDELEDLLARAEAFRARDDRVEIIDQAVEDHGVLKLHNFYVRYLLPLMVEVQHYEYTPSRGEGE